MSWSNLRVDCRKESVWSHFWTVSLLFCYRMSEAGQAQPLCLLMWLVRENIDFKPALIISTSYGESAIQIQFSWKTYGSPSSSCKGGVVFRRSLSKAVLQICFSTAQSQHLSADTPLLTPLVIFLHYSDISWYLKYFLCRFLGLVLFFLL